MNAVRAFALMVFAVVVLLGNPSFGLRAQDAAGLRPEAVAQRRAQALAQKLALTEDQRVKVVTILVGLYEARAKEPTADETEAARQLPTAIKSNDPAAIDRIAATLGDLTRRLVAIDARTDATIFALLTPDQQERFRTSNGRPPSPWPSAAYARAATACPAPAAVSTPGIGMPEDLAMRNLDRLVALTGDQKKAVTASFSEEYAEMRRAGADRSYVRALNVEGIEAMDTSAIDRAAAMVASRTSQCVAIQAKAEAARFALLSADQRSKYTVTSSVRGSAYLVAGEAPPEPYFTSTLTGPTIRVDPDGTRTVVSPGSPKAGLSSLDPCSLVRGSDAEVILGPNPEMKVRKEERRGQCTYDRQGKPLDKSGNVIGAKTLVVNASFAIPDKSEFRRIDESALGLRGGAVSRSDDSALLTGFVGIPIFYRFSDGIGLAVMGDTGSFSVVIRVEPKIWSGPDASAKLVYIANLITVARQASLRFAGMDK